MKFVHLVVVLTPTFPRHISSRLLEALADSPVVLPHGARQTGKSTLVQHVTSGEHPARSPTFDDTAVLASATANPAGFLAGIGSGMGHDCMMAPRAAWLNSVSAARCIFKPFVDIAPLVSGAVVAGDQ